jgi:hypothetical protein
MRTLREIGPLAVSAVVVGGATWVVLAGGEALGSWLLAGLVLAHGLIHLMFLAPAPSRAAITSADGPSWPFDLRRSWLADRLGTGQVTAIGRAMVALVVGCSLLAALAIVGIAMPSAWWAPLLAASACASLALLVIGFSPSLLVGVGIDLAFVWLVFASGWRPAG